ncbi:MAG: GNAT family N-acetyltransferase [Lewinellaceae bacterium]|nr:GNAT family N-acetyltransferase [Saprospiraceae bacterium]MCB9333103.1 GNAT family N-acetyltransferase [Lewinellaceae bacterium]
MHLESARLRLIPLNYDQLLAYLQPDFQLETALGLEKIPRTISPRLNKAIHQTLLPAVADPSKNYLFCTIWTIVDKAQNQMVADLCFKGAPNEHGEIELGYGTYDAFRGQGYMTEAVQAIAAWAFAQPGVTAILAETNLDNIASQRILEKNKFTQTKTTEESIWWKLLA